MKPKQGELYDPCQECAHESEIVFCDRCRYSVMVAKNTYDANELIKLRGEAATVAQVLTTVSLAHHKQRPDRPRPANAYTCDCILCKYLREKEAEANDRPR